jgi:hypothetical protein
MSILRSRAFIVGAIVVVAGAGVLTLLGAVLAIPLAGLVGYFVAAALDPPRPFTIGLLLGGVAAVAMAFAWSAETPTFSLLGEPPDQMGWQIPAIAMLLSVGLGGVVTKSLSVLFGPSQQV